MNAEVQQCPKCGAPIPSGRMRCNYCGAFLKFPRVHGLTAEKSREIIKKSFLGTKGEFGFQGKKAFWIGIGIGLFLYLLGWIFEDTRYWLQNRAIVVWAVLMPGWWFFFSLSRRPKWGGWLLGIAIGAAIFVVHLALMSAIRGRIQDDYVGIAFIFSAASMAGWFGGRIVHLIVRKARRSAMIYSEPPDQLQ